MNQMILGKIRSAARRIGGWTQTRDEFGRSIDFYNGVPLLDIGTKADGTLIIPQTETQGTASNVELDLRVRSARTRPTGRHRPDQRRRPGRGPRRAGGQARLPHPHRVLLRPRRVRQGRRAPARRPEPEVKST
jgi:hypothetical protein